VRESLQVFGALSAFFVLVVTFVLFARLDPDPGTFPVRLDVDPGRFSERLRRAALGTEAHIGWLLGISVAFLAGSFVATLTRHSWADGDNAAQRVGAFSLSISALASPFVLLLIAGSFVDEGLLPAALMSAFVFFVVALLAVYVGRFASATPDERFAQLEGEIERVQLRFHALSAPGKWWLSAVVSIALAAGMSAVAGVAAVVLVSMPFESAGALGLGLILASVACVVALIAFVLAVGIHIARDLYTRVLLASTGLGTAIISVVALWLGGGGALQQLVDVTLTIAVGVPLLSAVVPGRLVSSRLTIAGAARRAAAKLIERRARKLADERDRFLRQNSPLLAK
jgi:hypothetical protein